MKMKEICARSGLTEKAVRLYCERGLVQPEKYRERGREYLVFSDRNLRELSVVAELRRVDFSLDEIALMMDCPERCREVLESWKGRVSEQNQRLSRAKELLDAVSDQESLSAEHLAELLEAKNTAHGAAPYFGETFAEFCERSSGEPTELSEPMQQICEREEQGERFGRLFLIFYSVIMGVVTIISGIMRYATTQTILSGLLGIVLFVVLTVFLFRGAIWARVVSIIRHILSAFFSLWQIQYVLPGASLGLEHMTGMDGTITVVKQVMPTELGILLTGMMIIACILDLVCVYMLWFHRGLKEYLYERSL